MNIKSKLCKLLLVAVIMTAAFNTGNGVIYAADVPVTPGVYGIAHENGVEFIPQTVEGNSISPLSAEINSVTVNDFYEEAVKFKLIYSGVESGNYYQVTVQSSQDLPDKENLVYINMATALNTSVELDIYPSILESGTYYIFIADKDNSRTQIASFEYYSEKDAEDARNRSYTITFNANGGSVTPESSVTNSGGKLASLPVPVMEGYKFEGWYDSETGGNQVTSDMVFTGSGTLYARWAPEESISENIVEFSDVPSDAYYAEAVDWAVKKGITSGTGGTLFSPDDSCTRAQMVTFLWRDAGSPEPESMENPFADVDVNDYYGKAVLWAVEKGITNGVSETAFAPEEIVSRAQSVTFMCRSVNGDIPDGETRFEDIDKNMYYADSVTWAVAVGVTAGTGIRTFSPDDDCTRAQIVTFLYRYYVKV